MYRSNPDYASLDFKKPCQWFLQGNCNRGTNCRFSHSQIPEAPLSGVAAALNSATGEHAYRACGICLDPIQLFAVLLGCDHQFCMPCIHRWRTEVPASANRQTIKARRSCPLCRAHSDYVISSPIFVQGDTKHALKREHVKSKRNTPCRDWTKDKKCKFGGHCFYAHLDESGKCCKRQQLADRAHHLRILRSLSLGYPGNTVEMILTNDAILEILREISNRANNGVDHHVDSIHTVAELSSVPLRTTQS